MSTDPKSYLQCEIALVGIFMKSFSERIHFHVHFRFLSIFSKKLEKYGTIIDGPYLSFVASATTFLIIFFDKFLCGYIQENEVSTM